VPETSRVSLEEMDAIFGGSGVARADAERMNEINAEIGLDKLLREQGGAIHQANSDISDNEKVGTATPKFQ